MNANLCEQTVVEHCNGCGNRLAVVPSPQDDGRYLCECCYLRERESTLDCCAGLISGFAETLVETLDLREHETGLHSRRVACHTLVLARHFTADRQQLNQIYWGALLHDLGKIGVPDSVLLKPGRLDAVEWEIMRRHPEAGFRIVRELPEMAEAAEVVLCHEEHFDGSGYPRGLSGDAIPVGARIFSVIDALDAMTSDRPYRKAMGFDAAIIEIGKHQSAQFDPKVIVALEKERDILKRMVEMKCTVESPHLAGLDDAQGQERQGMVWVRSSGE